MNTTPDIATEYARWKNGGVRKADIAEQYGMTYGQLAGKFWRYEQHLKKHSPQSFPIFYTPLKKPWQFEWNSFMTFADVHLPHVNETWLDLSCQVAQRYLDRPRRLILAGDLVNLDAFSSYDPDGEGQPGLPDEIKAASVFFLQLADTFDEIYWLWGNHERRGTRGTGGVLEPLLLARLIIGNNVIASKVNISSRGYCFVDTSSGPWIVAHGRNYSVQRLNVAESIAWKFQRHVVLFHEHHLAHGFDRYGHFQIINGGGLFDYEQLAYAVQDASKSAVMKNGFVLFKDGYPHVLGPDGFTDWRVWLPDERGKKAQAQAAR